MTDWHGIYPILYTFWDDEGRIDRDAMKRQVDYCVASGAHGISILGLVTEVNKMDVTERREIVEMVGDMIGGRVPYAVTVGEPSIRGQIEFCKAAQAAGADWVILQPPSIPGMSQAELIRFFGNVADATDLGVAIQNNPVNMDVSLSPEGLIALNRQHPNISLLKGEGFSVDIARAIEGSGGAYRVFGGHGGIEFPALLRSGGAGLIPAPDFLQPQVKMYNLWREGTPESIARAEEIHRRLLPAIVFMSRNFPALLCYGKRLFAGQLGISPGADRAPALQPTEFGLAEMARHADEIAGAAD